MARLRTTNKRRKAKVHKLDEVEMKRRISSCRRKRARKQRLNA